MKCINYYANKPEELVEDIRANMTDDMTFEEEIELAKTCLELWPIVEAAQKAFDESHQENGITDADEQMPIEMEQQVADTYKIATDLAYAHEDYSKIYDIISVDYSSLYLKAVDMPKWQRVLKKYEKQTFAVALSITTRYPHIERR